ncbi:MAG: DUF998 domain-containing protein [Saprospiraceae bacterium]
MNQKPHALAGIAAPLLFVSAYLLAAAARPEFNHFTRAVSELGSVHAPNAVFWNVLGFICPGLLVAFFAIGLHQAVGQGNAGQLPFYALFLSGSLMVVAGLFPGDFEHRGSFTTIMHAIGTFGSFIAFLVAAFTYPLFLRKSDFWEKTIVPSLTLTWLCILSGFLRTGMAPGIGQRVGFAFYFLWIAFMAVNLYRHQRFS